MGLRPIRSPGPAWLRHTPDLFCGLTNPLLHGLCFRADITILFAAALGNRYHGRGLLCLEVAYATRVYID